MNRPRLRFDLEHPVGDVFAGALAGEAGPPSRSLESAELAPPLIDGDNSTFRVELGLHLRVDVPARDLPDPPAGPMPHDQNLELGEVPGCFGEPRLGCRRQEVAPSHDEARAWKRLIA